MCFSCTLSAGEFDTTEKEIRDTITYQIDNWNKGDLDGFMQYYWNSSDFTFQSGSNRTKGWQTLYDKYKKKYFADDGERGILTFTDIEIHVLSKTSAYVIGHWRVTGDDISGEGLFTLILRRFDEGWRIVHDHTS
jgi:beta-aspartyl-peptidase (threonine type)